MCFELLQAGCPLRAHCGDGVGGCFRAVYGKRPWLFRKGAALQRPESFPPPR